MIFADISKEALPKMTIWANIKLLVFAKELSISVVYNAAT